MIPFKNIFRLLAVLSIIAGCICYITGLRQMAEVMVKSGMVIWLITWVFTCIRIPKNSMGTPLERGLEQEHMRMILKDR
jgi:hypothetical protein